MPFAVTWMSLQVTLLSEVNRKRQIVYNITYSCKGSLVAQLVKNLLAMQETWGGFLGGEVPLERGRLPTPVFLGFPGGADGKESACSVEYLSSVPGLGRSPEGGHGNPPQYYSLENPHGQRNLAGYSS